jgi:hypothetical protein
MIQYSIDIKVEYTNNYEYRLCLRDLFNMDKKVYEDKIKNIEKHNQENLDDISKDEISYDDNAASLMMEYIFNSTKDIIEYQELYKNAALKMFSEDLTIGQSILMSYDYLHLYHLCLVDFFKNGFNKDFYYFIKLSELLSK